MSVEAELLKRILADQIRLIEGEVHYYHRNHRVWKRKVANQHPVSGRYRYKFQLNGKQATVYRNRLYWILAHKQPIPDDHVIDHEDLDSQNDHPDNLQLMHVTESHRQGQGVQYRGHFMSLFRWFHFIEIYGRPPEPSEEDNDSLIF